MSPIREAVERGDIDTVEKLIAIDRNLADDATETNDTLVHLAARRGDAKMLHLLILQGDLVNARDIYGNTPLHCACQEGEPECATILLASGASVEARNKAGFTSLFVASRTRAHRASEVVDILLANGAHLDLNSAIVSGRLTQAIALAKDPASYEHALAPHDLLEDAIQSRNVPLARVFIDHGVDVNDYDLAGAPPLFSAARIAMTDGDSGLFELLLLSGADTSLRNCRGEHLLEYVQRFTADGTRKAAVRALIESHGA